MAAFAAQPLPVILLMGPTASGKTDLALQLALRLPVEIISVDSAQVYRHMDIGTAKPAQQIRQRFIHHLVDIRDPAEPYSAAEFKADAQALIRQIQARGKIPLLVGGTTLYFRTLTQGLSSLPAADVQIRAELGRRLPAWAGRRCTRDWRRSIQRRRSASIRTIASASSAPWRYGC